MRNIENATEKVTFLNSVIVRIVRKNNELSKMTGKFLQLILRHRFRLRQTSILPIQVLPLLGRLPHSSTQKGLTKPLFNRHHRKSGKCSK